MRRLLLLLLAIVAALAAVTPASASTLITRNARNLTLTTNGDGMAAMTFREPSGRVRHVVAWGAINADVRFRLDYAGGWGHFHRQVWKSIKACGDYDGPRLDWLVVACKAPDGSYWAIQAWQRMLPDLGYRPRNWLEAAREFRLSHWRGEIPKLEIYLDWVYGGKYHHLFGRYTYRGKPVHGFRSTSTGVPLDRLGRNIYLDTYNSAYGPGWRRENSFLAHKPDGNFCYGFFPHKSYYDKSRRPAGHGRRYRAMASGPGVAPDPFWTALGLGEFDQAYEQQMNKLSDEIAGSDRLCHRH
jgi:hypothetical protein